MVFRCYYFRRGNKQASAASSRAPRETTYMYVYMYIYIYIYTYICIYCCIYIYIERERCIYLSLSLYIYIYTYSSIVLSLSLYISLSLSMYIYIYIYTTCARKDTADAYFIVEMSNKDYQLADIYRLFIFSTRKHREFTKGGLVKGGLASYVLLLYYCETPPYQTPLCELPKTSVRGIFASRERERERRPAPTRRPRRSTNNDNNNHDNY